MEFGQAKRRIKTYECPERPQGSDRCSQVHSAVAMWLEGRLPSVEGSEPYRVTSRVLNFCGGPWGEKHNPPLHPPSRSVELGVAGWIVGSDDATETVNSYRPITTGAGKHHPIPSEADGSSFGRRSELQQKLTLPSRVPLLPDLIRVQTPLRERDSALGHGLSPCVRKTRECHRGFCLRLAAGSRLGFQDLGRGLR